MFILPQVQYDFSSNEKVFNVEKESAKTERKK